jgi:flagellar biosynthesis/type III secretory pathway protein FliH
MLIVPEIEKAFAIADRVNLSLEEIDDLEKREQFERERIGAIELGKAQGRTEGRTEGIQIGEQIGEQRGKINLIKRLLQRQLGELNQSIEDSLSQLTSEQLSALAEAIFDFSSMIGCFDFQVLCGDQASISRISNCQQPPKKVK